MDVTKIKNMEVAALIGFSTLLYLLTSDDDENEVKKTPKKAKVKKLPVKETSSVQFDSPTPSSDFSIPEQETVLLREEPKSPPLADLASETPDST
jgi:hypothetical protein